MDNLTEACLKHVFNHKHHIAGGKEKKVIISVFELFKESVHDLVSGNMDIDFKSMPMDSGVTISGLQEQVQKRA